MKNIKTMTVRFDLSAERDNTVWNYLHTSGKKLHKNCNNAVIEEIGENIRTKEQMKNMKDVLSDTVRSAIRDEFSRIIKPQDITISSSETVETENEDIGDFDMKFMFGGE